MTDDDRPNVYVLAREIGGHLVPQLVMARAFGHLGPKISAIGAATLARGGADFYQVTIDGVINLGSWPAFQEKPPTYLLVPLLIVRHDAWDEHYIELVDRDGYQVMAVARHWLSCEINGHWFQDVPATEDEAAHRRCAKCGAPQYPPACRSVEGCGLGGYCNGEGAPGRPCPIRHTQINTAAPVPACTCAEPALLHSGPNRCPLHTPF